MRKYTSFVFFLLGYSIVTFYIGWNGWVWLQSFTSIEVAWLYSCIVAVLAYTYFLGQRFPTVLAFRIIGAYWFGFMQYSLMLLPISNLAVWLLGFTSFNKSAMIFIELI